MILVVTGPAGSGKTRLAQRLARALGDPEATLLAAADWRALRALPHAAVRILDNLPVKPWSLRAIQGLAPGADTLIVTMREAEPAMLAELGRAEHESQRWGRDRRLHLVRLDGPAPEQTRHFTTYTGAEVWFLDPSRTPVLSLDLYVHAGRICRYGGALPWSLLQHTALCVRLGRLDPSAWITELLPYVAAHDLHEVYVGDVVAAMKQVLPEYKARIEGPWEARVHTALGLAWPAAPALLAAVKRIDLRALAVEMIALGHPRADIMRERYAQKGEDIEEGELAAAIEIRRTPPPRLWHDLVTALPTLGQLGPTTVEQLVGAHVQGPA